MFRCKKRRMFKRGFLRKIQSKISKIQIQTLLNLLFSLSRFSRFLSTLASLRFLSSSFFHDSTSGEFTRVPPNVEWHEAFFAEENSSSFWRLNADLR